MIANDPSLENGPHPLSDLLLNGDRACERADAAELRRVVEQLGPCVAEPLRRRLAEIVRLGATDLPYATKQWIELRRTLHHQLVDEFDDAAPH